MFCELVVHLHSLTQAGAEHLDDAQAEAALASLLSAVADNHDLHELKSPATLADSGIADPALNALHEVAEIEADNPVLRSIARATADPSTFAAHVAQQSRLEGESNGASAFCVILSISRQ